jgi:hypothetical protein
MQDEGGVGQGESDPISPSRYEQFGESARFVFVLAQVIEVAASPFACRMSANRRELSAIHIR